MKLGSIDITNFASGIATTPNLYLGDRLLWPAGETPPTPPVELPTGYTFYVDASDSDSYPGTGTTWFDLSGNGYDLTLSSSGVFVDDGGNDKYMNFDSGIAKYLPGGTLTDIPTTDGATGTWVFYTSLRNAVDLKTLIRNVNFVHPVIAWTDGVTLGNYVEPSFFNSGFNMTTIPNVYTEPHMMAWKFSWDTTPTWQFYYDSFTSTAQATLNNFPTFISNRTWASSCIGAWHGNSSSPTTFSQNWGKVWFAAYYPFVLSTEQLDQVNSYISQRYA